MTDKKTILYISLLALFAVTGLLLLLKTGNTGSGTLNMDIAAGRAIDTISAKRPYGGGSPEGLPVGAAPRRGWRSWEGREPCPYGYALERTDYYTDAACIPVKYPEYYVGRKCCPKSAH